MPRNTKNLQTPSSPHPFYPYPRYTHQTDQTLQAHFIDELPKTWGLRMSTQICLNPESTREKFNVLPEGFRWFPISRASNGFRSTPVLVCIFSILPNEPLPKNNLQETFPRFNFNKFQSIQTGSFGLTIFHVCRPHLHSCLGSWHLPTRKRHISSPFFLDGLPIEVVRFSTDHQRSCKSQGDKNLEILRSPIWSASQQQSKWKQIFQRNEHHGKLTISKLFGPIPIDPYMKQLLWNIELKFLDFFLAIPSNNIYSRKYGILQHSSQPASHPPHIVKQGTHQDPCGHSNDTQGQCQG